MNSLSPTIKAQQLVKERLLTKTTVYNFGLGANPFPIHKTLINKFKNSIDLKNYTYPNGDEELGKIISNQYTNDLYKVSNILVGNGLKELLFIIQMVFKGTIIHIYPAWVSYIEQTTLLNKPTINIKSNITQNFKITPELLDSAINNCKTNKILLLLNSPNNPTGTFYTDNELKQLAITINKYGDRIVVFSDEIYKNILHGNSKAVSISKYVNNSICGSSLSKEAGCGGWRMAWITFPSSLDYIYNDAYHAISTIYSCVSQPLIEVAKEFFLNTENAAYTKYMSKIFASAVGIVKDTISKLCLQNKASNKIIRFTDANSAWYLFLDVFDFENDLQNAEIYNSEQLCERLLIKKNIVTVAGSAFGCNSYCLRISCIDFKISGTCDNLIYDKSFAHLKKGVEELVNWFYEL